MSLRRVAPPGQSLCRYQDPRQPRLRADVRRLGAGAVSRILTDDCIATGRDYNAGGARYNTSYIQGVGIGTPHRQPVCHQAARLRRSCRRHWASCSQALDGDFDGCEALRQRLLNKTPRYGNDDDRADDLMIRCFEAYLRVGRRTAQPPRRRVPHQHAADDVPRVFRRGNRRDARWPPRGKCRCPRGSRRCRAPTARGRPRSSSRRPRWTSCDRWDPAQHEVHPPVAGGRDRAST